MLNKIVIIYGHEYSRLSDIRICCMCLISYAGFLRFSELVHLRRSDIVINEISVNLFVQKSKTDRFQLKTLRFLTETKRAKNKFIRIVINFIHIQISFQHCDWTCRCIRSGNKH
jgi:integrase